MRDNVMFISACILMVVEALALGFLTWSWCDASWGAKMWIYSANEVTHWMHLPEPPVEKHDE